MISRTKIKLSVKHFFFLSHLFASGKYWQKVSLVYNSDALADFRLLSPSPWKLRLKKGNTSGFVS